MSRVNDSAPANMYSKFVTDAVFQFSMLPLNDLLRTANIPRVLRTLLTSHLLRSRLNEKDLRFFYAQKP